MQDSHVRFTDTSTAADICCRNYHGCTENIWDRRKAWATLIDLNQYGESNNIMILYPQASGSASIGEGGFKSAVTKAGDDTGGCGRLLELGI